MFGRKSGRIRRTFRHLNRYREIASVLLKHGFGSAVGALGLRSGLRVRLLVSILRHEWL